MKDYSEYCDKEIVVTTRASGDRMGRVVAAEPGVGITIVDADNPNDYILCLNGPLSPNYIGQCPDKDEALFDAMIELIDSGKISEESYDRALRGIFPPGGTEWRTPSRSTCPFGQ